MGFKVIVFLGMFIGMVLLISSQVGACTFIARLASRRPKLNLPVGPVRPGPNLPGIPVRPKPNLSGIPSRPPKPNKPFCERKRFGKCEIPDLPSPPPPPAI
ncbi:hypothetical protein ACS0TY_025819 [Phlomoides rotata]